MNERIPPSRFGEHGWRVLRDDACTYLATGSFAKGVELVEAIGEFAAVGDRHPDIDLRPEGVTVRLGTHVPLPTEEDLALAERISAVARDLGVSTDLGGPTSTDRPRRFRTAAGRRYVRADPPSTVVGP